MRTPRPYQIGALHGDARGIGLIAGWLEHTSGLVVIPTGGGKTTVAAMAAEYMREVYPDKQIMFAVHLRKIVQQARESLAHYTGLDVGLELAERRQSSLDPEPIVCGSVQSLNSKNRIQRIDPNDYSLLILDEAHMGVTETWQTVKNHFCQNPNLKVLCLTATPARHDKKKLNGIVDFVAYEYSLKDAIAEGYLVKPLQRIQHIPGLDLSGISRAGRDLNQQQLAEKMIEVAKLTAHRAIEAVFGLYPHELDRVPEPEWDAYVGDREPRQSIAFTVNVAHAKAVAEVLNAFRPGLCVWGSGEMPEDEINEVFRRFESKEAAIFANCGLTIMGYDYPDLQMILDMAPTLSHTRAMQKFGRLSRTEPGTIDGLNTVEERIAAIAASGKPHSTVIDFAGNSGKHKLVTLVDVFGDTLPTAIKKEIKERAKMGAVDVELVAEEIKREIALRHSDFDETLVDGFTGKKKRLTRQEKDARRRKRDAKPISEKDLGRLIKAGLVYRGGQPWHPRNERETAQALTAANSSAEAVASYRAHLKKINHRYLAHLCTFGQARALRKRGWTAEEVERMKYHEAHKIFEKKINVHEWRNGAHRADEGAF